MTTIAAGLRAGSSASRRHAPRVSSPDGDALTALWLPPSAAAPAVQGTELAARRERHGWSQAELARRAGVHRTTLQRWERDVLTPTAEEAAALDRALAVEDPPADLDPLGKRRSPITLASYNRGRRAANAGRKFPPEPLSVTEVVALLEGFGTGKSGVRDRALTVLLWRGGLRIAEALALYPKDVDLAAGAVTVLKGKGAKRRTIGIDRVAVSYLQSWLVVRERLGASNAKHLFCTITKDARGPGRPINSSQYRNTLKGAAKHAGITKRVHPHGLRHTHAFETTMEGVPLNIVQLQLGHADLGMTQRYINHLAPAALIDAMRQRECPPELLPPKPAAVVTAFSQGEPASAPRDPVPARALAGDPVVTLVVPDPTKPTPGLPAEATGQQRVLDFLAANGRVSQPQITKALGLASSTTSAQLAKLQAKGLIVSAGYHREHGRSPSRIWRLAPPRVRVTIDQPHDPRERVGPIARPGYGRERVLSAIAGAEGRASQAQLARHLGIGTDTIARHCRALAEEGKLIRGGLDKSTSNRGSQVWRLPQAIRYTAAGAGRLSFSLQPSLR